jgi:hypothetical protein
MARYFTVYWRLLSIVGIAIAGTIVAGCGARSGTLPQNVVAGAAVSPENSAVACPTRAVFLRLFGEIRGYRPDASGPTQTCTDIKGRKTRLTGNGSGYGAIQASPNGYLHATVFQSNAAHGGLLIFLPNANGNVAPWRDVNVTDQDQIALATDSQSNDFVVSNQGYSSDSCWYVIPHGKRIAQRQNCDSRLQQIYALATDPANDLLAIGFDATTKQLRIDVFRKPGSQAPTRIRTIEGPATGFPTFDGSYFDYGFSLATDSVSGAIYVYLGGPGSGVTRVDEFVANAHGNVAPERVIGGSRTQLPATAFGTDVIAVGGGLLYASTQAPSILVFGAHSHGNVAPERTITDPHVPTQELSVGIAVRL